MADLEEGAMPVPVPRQEFPLAALATALAYYPDANERQFAAQVVRRLAWIGIVLGSLGLLGTLALAVLRSGIFSGMALRFPGGVWESVRQAAHGGTWAILVASAPLALKLRPAGRRGMLVYAVAATGVSGIAAGVALFGIMTDGYPGMTAADRAYLITSTVFHAVGNAAYPVVVLTVLHIAGIRDAFKP